MLAEQGGIFKLHVGLLNSTAQRRSEQLNIDAPRLEAIARKTFHRVPAMRNA
ncbi:hypothetical protein ALO54_101703 [Pseudomonas syringae pv. philadelphi]|uniref:Uncharacterized protein n=1 Tax=Pseudomonas syringae pv. theae TaxID=103985 RepID=A0A3M5NMS5_PSESX|nr:hypothetical protein ALO86_101511 [Pseudomonas syringae pv. berberidis]KPY23517.1 hypothetical protein ALO54_101703 [Pseudomonas syringae pv. philadelphi]RMR23311.1 hypothetical protein ALP89_101808 [Pseudomonas syringae pv. persicae]RMT72956.1 hypothetical protein ALP44_101998 [Pseudomonas syringae pv. theae]RMM16232.1 hypothetical protein ALQ83_101758 [Pseudomonas syringae pv. berberidis]